MGWFGRRLSRVASAPAEALASKGPGELSRASDGGSGDGRSGEAWQELLLGHFQLLGVLGAGGYSTV